MLSVKEIFRELEIKKLSVAKCLKANKLHPHHIRINQELIEAEVQHSVYGHWAK